MRVPAPSGGRLAFCYLAAILVSFAALGLMAAVQPYVGFLPMLFLPAILLVWVYWGLGPAVVATVLCTAGSLLLMGARTSPAEPVYVWANLLLLPGIAGSLLYLMETRRLHRRIEHERSMELSLLLDSMPEAVFVFDTTGHVVDVNRAGQQLAQRDRRRLVGMHLRELASLLGAEKDGEPLDYQQLAVVRALRGETVRDERRILHHRGDARAVNAVLAANPMRDESGNVIGVLLVLRDVTEVTELQGRIADTERHLAIGQMAAGIAHDFNNVLDTIAQATSVLELRSLGGEERVYVGMIQNAVRRGAEIISRVREYIRGGTGELRAVDVVRSLEEALELTGPLWRAAKDLRIERDLQAVPPVRANAADLRRVFANLIINAIQAMPKGGTLTVRCSAVNHTVVASVSDTGVGIAPAQHKHIFLPYYTTKPQGTGLGLSGAQRIVQALGGTIRFSSEVGKGTTFTIELPQRAAQENGRKAA